MTLPQISVLVINGVIILLYILSLLRGVKEGFLLQLLSCISLLAALFIAWLFSPVLAEMFNVYPVAFAPGQDTLFATVIYQSLNNVIWFVILFLLVEILLLLLRPLVKMMQELPLLKQVNEILGGIFSLVTTTIWLFIFALILTTPIFTNGQEIAQQSFLAIPTQLVMNVSKDIGKNLGQISEEQLAQWIEGWEDLTDDDRTLIRQWLGNSPMDEASLQALMEKLKGE